MAARVEVGQAAEVVVDLLPDQTFRGEVTRFLHKADIQKNTVEAKVRISHPPCSSPRCWPGCASSPRASGTGEVERTIQQVFVE